jgi:hypothetical protein
MLVTELQCKTCVKVLIYLVRISTSNESLIKTDLTVPTDGISHQSTSSGRTVATFKGNIDQSKVCEVSVWNMKAHSFRKGKAALKSIVDVM